MKTLVLSLTVIAAFALSSGKPAEQKAASGNTNAGKKFPFIIPQVTYGEISATTSISDFPNQVVTYHFSTTEERYLGKFRVYRKNISDGDFVETKDVGGTNAPYNYHCVFPAIAGETYEFSVHAISSDGEFGAATMPYIITVPGVAR